MAIALQAPAVAAPSRFTGRIDRRLSLFFAVLLLTVLVVGGSSAYLLGSLLLESEPIARQSEQVYALVLLHKALLEFAGAAQVAQATGRPLAAATRTAYATQLATMVARYRAAGGSTETVDAIHALVAEAETLAVEAGTRTRRSGSAGRTSPRADWDTIRERMNELADRASATHSETEQRQIRRSHRTLTATMALNVAFVVAGVVLLIVAHRHFHRAIAIPLRALADRSSALATGAPYRPIAVRSSDEIGRLTDAFNGMAEQLRDHEARMKSLVTLEERQRLAGELHDRLAQDLALLRLAVVEADDALDLHASAATSEVVQRMFATLDTAHQNLREAIFGLRALDSATSTSFIASLEEHLADFSRLRNVRVDLDVRVRDVVVAPVVRTQLSRIVHEALSNVARHAAATRASVTVDADPHTVRVAITDDGVGFSVTGRTADASRFGLRTMKERAESVGGTLVVESGPGRGTRVVVEAPVEQA